MADPITEILQHRMRAGDEARSELAGYRATLNDIRQQIQKLERITNLNAQQRQQLNHLRDREHNNATYIQTRLQPAIRDAEAAAKAFEAHSAMRDPGSRARSLMPASLRDELDARDARLAEYEAKSRRARSPKSQLKWQTKAQQEEREYAELTDELYRVPFENAKQILKKAIADAKRNGGSLSLSEYSALKRELDAGQIVSPDTDPGIRREYDRATASGLRGFGMSLRSRLKDPNNQWSMGFAALQLGTEAGQLGALGLDGQRHTRESVNRAVYGLLPGVGGLIGSAWGPMGGMVGGALGTVGTSLLSAGSEREEALRMNSEAISHELGRGAGAATAFAVAMEQAASRLGTPAAELAEHSRMIAGTVSGFSTGGVNYQAYLQSQLGDAYPGYAAAQGRFTAAPFSLGYRNMLASGKPGTGQYYGAALYLAATGDRQGAYSQIALGGTQTETPELAALTANINAGLADTGSNPIARYLHGLSGSRWQREIHSWQARRDKLINSGGGYISKADGAQRAFIDNLIDTMRQSGDTADLADVSSESGRLYAQQSVLRGRGVRGFRSDIATPHRNAQIALSSLRTQESQILAAIGQAPDTESKERLQIVLAQTRARIAQTQGTIEGDTNTVFRMSLSEQEAVYTGKGSRLGSYGELHRLQGGSVYTEGGLYARRGRLAADRAAHLAALAADTSNNLSPEERQSYRSEALQLRIQARFGLANERSTRMYGEMTQASGVRGSGIGVMEAMQSVQGSPIEQLSTATVKIQEQVRLRHELEGLLQNGTLTLEQHRQIQTQINQSIADEIRARKQAVDAAIDGMRQMASAAAGVHTAQSSRMEFMGGSSAASFGHDAASSAGALQALAILKFQRDHETNPLRRAQLAQQYEEQALGIEQDTVRRYGHVAYSPGMQIQELRLTNRLSRQERSPYEGGSALDTAAKLAGLDSQKLRAIQQQRDRARRAGKLYAPVELGLEQQEEGVRNDLFDRQQNLDLGWINRLVSMSVGSPSFASRLMPGADRVASIAEARGLGRMSSRVFGFYNPQSYADADLAQFAPSDISRFGFGYRPGDHPGMDSMSGLAADGGYLTPGSPIDDVESGKIMPGAGADIGELTQALTALHTALINGIRLQVDITDERSGRSTSRVINTQKQNDSSSLQRGGDSSVNR
jgi:hypothetical protein